MLKAISDAADKFANSVTYGGGGKYEKLANALGASRSAIYRWKTIPPDKVVILAGILRVAPETLRPDLAKIFKPPKGRK